MGLFGGGKSHHSKNPMDAAMPFLNQMDPLLQQYYQPYIQAGNRQLPNLESQYGQLTNDPGGFLNKVGQNYQQSPGFDFAMKQALQGAGHAAAAGGMAGSPQHEQQNMQLASDIASQDYDRWMREALGLYGEGLGGQQNLYGLGAQAGMGLGTNLADIQGMKAKMAYEARKARNQEEATRRSSLWGSLGGLAGGALGSFGGPIGAAVGSSIGSNLGSMM